MQVFDNINLNVDEVVHVHQQCTCLHSYVCICIKASVTMCVYDLTPCMNL